MLLFISYEPEKKDPREVWEKHAILVLKKILSIDYYIMCDIAYPPYWFIYQIHRNTIMDLYRDGTFQWDLGDHRDGLIKNKISRSQFYTHILGMQKHNPHMLDWTNKEANPFEVSDKSITKNIEMLNYRTDRCSWIKIKDQDKKLVEKANSESLVENL